MHYCLVLEEAQLLGTIVLVIDLSRTEGLIRKTEKRSTAQNSPITVKVSRFQKHKFFTIFFFSNGGP